MIATGNILFPLKTQQTIKLQSVQVQSLTRNSGREIIVMISMKEIEFEFWEKFSYIDDFEGKKQSNTTIKKPVHSA